MSTGTPDVQQSATYVTVFGRRIPREDCDLLYAVAVIQEYHMAEAREIVVQALKILGDVVAETDDGPLAEEAALTVKALIDGDKTFPVPRAAEDLLRNKAAPSRPRCIAIETLARKFFMDVEWNAPEYVVMVPGPLQDALHARNPHANPKAEETNADADM